MDDLRGYFFAGDQCLDGNLFPGRGAPVRLLLPGETAEASIHVAGRDFINHNPVRSQLEGHALAQHAQAGLGHTVGWNLQMHGVMIMSPERRARHCMLSEWLIMTGEITK